MLPPGLSIYFIRHGQTDWNAELRMQGQLDIPLNDTGRAQAARHGRVLHELIADPDQYDFIASPLARASETMEIVRREMGLPPNSFRTNPLLKEIHYGGWEGSTWDELRARDPEAIAARFTDPWNTVAPGGESFAMLSERVLTWLQSVDRDTIVAAHGAFSRCLRGHILGLSHEEIFDLEVPQDRFFSIRQGQIDWH
jgi:probable phosphoglycerate mutase